MLLVGHVEISLRLDAKNLLVDGHVEISLRLGATKLLVDGHVEISLRLGAKILLRSVQKILPLDQRPRNPPPGLITHPGTLSTTLNHNPVVRPALGLGGRSVEDLAHSTAEVLAQAAPEEIYSAEANHGCCCCCWCCCWCLVGAGADVGAGAAGTCCGSRWLFERGSGREEEEKSQGGARTYLFLMRADARTSHSE